jgi:hypothetical protein
MSVRRWRRLGRPAVGLLIAGFATVGVIAVSPTAAHAIDPCPIQNGVTTNCLIYEDPEGVYASELIASAVGFSSISSEDAIFNARENAQAECRRRARLANATEPKIYGGSGEVYDLGGNNYRAIFMRVECRYRVA